MQEDYPSREEERGLINKFEELLKNKGFHFFDIEEYETIIHYYLDRLQYGKGIKACKMALEQYPFSLEISVLLSQCLVGKEKFDEALKVIEDAENLHPNDPELLTVK
ncbi:MAG TPA: tetratricopeptide repeat protein, partial [Roseivirga sp.]